MSLKLKFEAERKPRRWKLGRFVSLPGRLAVWMFDTLADWMDSRVFQVIRIVGVGAVVWCVMNRFDSRTASGGLSSADLQQYWKAAVFAALAGVSLSVLWSSAFCDGMAGIVMHLIDDPDDRPVREDPMDKIRRLIDRGSLMRARRLCKRMIRRKEGSRVALETLIEHLEARRRNDLPRIVGRIRGGK